MKKLSKRGFTLVELLLVIAIIGILAAAVIFGLAGQRKRANFSNVVKSATAVNSYVADCYMRGQVLADPTSANSGGGVICSGAGAEWPIARMAATNYSADADCQYYSIVNTANNQAFSIVCDTDNTSGINAGSDAAVTCTGSTGACVQGTSPGTIPAL